MLGVGAFATALGSAKKQLGISIGPTASRFRRNIVSIPLERIKFVGLIICNSVISHR